MNTRIKEARKEAKMTQSDLAEKLKLSKNYIYLIESGREKPSSRTVSDIARILHVNETWLLTGDGEMYSPVTREQEMARVVERLALDPESFRAKAIMLLAEIDDEYMDTIEEVVRMAIEKYKEPAENTE